MTPLQVAAYVSQVAAAAGAILLARRRPQHAPAAVALGVLAAINILDAPIAAAITPFPTDPWEGWSRVLVYLDGAINLAGYATIAGLSVAVAVAPERRRRAVAIIGAVWLAASGVLAALYPSPLVRGAGLQRIYLAADLIGLFVSVVALVTWARAGIAAKRSPGSAPLVAIGMAALDFAILIAPYSPWRGYVFSERYDGVQLIITFSFATLAVVQVIGWKSTSAG